MSNQAQGAVGAETMTAGRIAYDEFSRGAAGYGFNHWKQRPPEYHEAWERIASAVLNHAALASPRPDSAERTAGDDRKWTVPRAVLVEAVAQHFHDEEHEHGGHAWTWPEYADDDGRRGNSGYVSITPPVVQMECREAAERLVRLFEGYVAPPAPATPPGVPDSVRALLDQEPELTTFGINPEGGPDVWVEGTNRFCREDNALKYREWARSLKSAVRTLISAHPAGQSEQPILRATVDVFANRTDTRLSFGDRTQPEPGVKAVQQAIAALTAEYEARGGCPVVGRHPAGQSAGSGAFLEGGTAAMRNSAAVMNGHVAPDSTRTGDEGAEDGARMLWACYEIERYGGTDPSYLWDQFPDKWKRIWRAVYKRSLAAPPASSGQGGR